MDYDVIVVGAGLSGLSAAYYLQKYGKNVIVLESEPQIGGRTRTLQLEDGSIHAVGAEFFTPEYKNIIKLCKELNVELKPIKQLYTVKFNNTNWEFGYTKILSWIKDIGFLNILVQGFNIPHLVRLYYTNSFNLKKIVQSESVDMVDFIKKLKLPKDLVDLIAAVNRLTFHYVDGLNEINAGFLINWVKHISKGLYLLPVNGINSFAEALGKNLNIECNFEVNSINKTNNYWEIASSHKMVRGKKIVVTLPKNISYQLLKNTNLAESLQNLLKNTEYSKLQKYYVQTQETYINNGTVIVEPPENKYIEFYTQIAKNLGVVKVRPEYFKEELDFELIANNIPVKAIRSVTDIKIEHALPLYNTEHIKRVINYLDNAKTIAKENNIVLAGDFIYGPYTESAVYSGIKAAELIN